MNARSKLRLALAVPATVLALAGCEVPTGGLLIPDEAIEVFGDADAAAIFGTPSTSALFATFETRCESNLGNLSRVPAQLRADGYVVLARDSELIMFAHPASDRAVVALAGDRASDPEFCMVMAPDTAANRSAFERYLNGKPGNERLDVQLPDTQAAYINLSAQRVYVSVRETNQAVGPLLGIGVGPL